MENDRRIGNQPENQTGSYAEHVAQVSMEIAQMARAGAHPTEIRSHEIGSVVDYLAQNPGQLQVLLDNSGK